MNVADSQTGHRGAAPAPAMRRADRARRRRRHPAQHLRDPRACRGARARPAERPRAAQAGRARRSSSACSDAWRSTIARALVEKAPWLDLVAGPDAYRRLPELLGRRAASIRSSTCASIAPKPMPTSRRSTARAFAPMSLRCADATSSAPFAWCPTCADASAACRPPTSCAKFAISPRAASRRSCCSGRPSTPIASMQTDFGALLRMVAARRRHRADPLHLAASERHDRSRYRRDGLRAQGPALSASAAAIGLRSRARCDGARLHCRRNISSWSSALRAAIPGLALSTDIIVGFHGEEESDFRRDARSDARGRLRLGLHLQVFGARTHPRLSPRRYRQRSREAAPPQ